jgi:hypothetical protein
VAVNGGTVTFEPGDLTRTVEILINGDTQPELDEFFRVNITNVSNGAIVRGSAVGTIINDDPVPPQVGVEGDIVDGSGGPGGDSLVLANDVTAIRQFILGTAVPSPLTNQFQRADVNVPCGNGQIDAGDVTVIRQMILGTVPSNTPTCGPIFVGSPGSIEAKRFVLVPEDLAHIIAAGLRDRIEGARMLGY